MANINKIKLPTASNPYNLRDAGAVRFDSAQSLTTSQQSQARNNIGVPTIPTISTNVASDSTSNTKTVSPKAVKDYVDSRVSAAYKASGSVTFANLPGLDASRVGNVYNVTDAFTTTSDFVEGAGSSYPAGTNVAIVSSGSSYKYDALAGFVDLSGYVPKTRTVNGKALSADISLTASDIGAAASSHSHSNYVPTTRKINSKALSADITLSASDVNAVPNTRKVNNKELSSDISLTAIDVGAASSSHTHTYTSLTSKPTISRGQVVMSSGSHTTVTVPFTVKNSSNLLVYKDGLLLAPTHHYTLSNNIITLVGFSAYLDDIFDFIEFNL